MRAEELAPSTADGIPRQIRLLQHARPHGIVDVVIDVGDQIGDAHDLPFERGGALRRIDADRRAVLPLRVTADAVAHLPRQVQAASVVLEHVHDAKALLVVAEAAGHERIEHALAGVAERRVPKVVAERDRFGQLLVQLQHLGDRARDLRHLERVRQTCPVVIAGRGEEHLRLVLQPPERLAVDDAIPIVLKRRPHIVFGLGPETAARVGALGRLRRQRLPLALLEAFTDGGQRCPPGSSCRGRAVRRRSSPRASGRDRQTSCACPMVRRLAPVPCPTTGPTSPTRESEARERSREQARDQQRHVLARMIGARRARIVAVIGGHDQQIGLTQRSAAGARALVELLEIGRVAAHVVAMAVERVEVDEVGEDEPLVRLAHHVVRADPSPLRRWRCESRARCRDRRTGR